MTNSSQCRCARTHRRHFNCRPTMMAKRYHCCDAGHSTSNLYKSILLYQGRQKHVGRVRRPLAWLARFSFYSRYKFHPALVLNIKHQIPTRRDTFLLFPLIYNAPLTSLRPRWRLTSPGDLAGINTRSMYDHRLKIQSVGGCLIYGTTRKHSLLVLSE